MMFRLPHTRAGLLFASVLLAALLSGFSLILDWRASRHVSSVDPTAFVLTQHVLWGLGTVLATAATVAALLALSAGVSSLLAPWRWLLGFAVFLLSPVIGFLFGTLFYALLTLPTADEFGPIVVSPGRLSATLPAVLGIAALLAVGRPRAKSEGPA